MFSHFDPRLTAFGRAFAIASLAHLLLPDYAQDGWTGPALLQFAGAFWLLYRPALGGFLLCLLSTLWPLFALRDVMTQSMLLTWWAAIGAVTAGAHLSGRRWGRAALDAITLLTAGTYALAALHKLNDGFFDPELSCAPHALRQIEAFFAFELPGFLHAGSPYIAVSIEVLLVGLILARSPLRWPLAACFHFPLTMTLAPAFAFVMAAGLAAGCSPREAVYWRRLWRHRRRAVLLSYGTASLGWLLYRGGVQPLQGVKAGAFAVAIGFALLGPQRLRRWRPRRAAIALAILWLGHGLTPYFGVQYQHTGAMLSNLRIDDECFNSWIFPVGLRREDPYLRITVARIGTGQRPRKERVLIATLWNRPALHTMHANWCIDALRPIYLEGTLDGQRFVIDDLCDEGWHDALPGGPGLRGFQRFQKNLLRRCDAACVH